jgi:hypothetical protein
VAFIAAIQELIDAEVSLEALEETAPTQPPRKKKERRNL